MKQPPPDALLARPPKFSGVLSGVAGLCVCGLLGVAGAASAQSFTAPLPLVQSCFEPTGDISTLVDTLTQAGWRIAATPDAQTLERIAWMDMPNYFAGDSGGMSLAYILDLKRKDAAAFARKRDLPNVKQAILERSLQSQGETVLVRWLKTRKGGINLRCSFALVSDSLTNLPAPQPGANFTRLPSRSFESDGRIYRAEIVFINRAALTAELGQPVPVDAIVQTTLSYLAKDL